MNSQVVATEKRALDSSSPTTIVTKRRKVETAEFKVKGLATKDGSDKSKVGASELASAFALASLASLSPGSNKATIETRDAKHKQHKDEGVRNIGSFDEARSPKADTHPSSPDQRSPGSPKAQEHPSTPEDRSMSNARRVHFTPAGTQQTVATPSTPISRTLPAASPRQLQAPPRTPTPQRHGAFVPRPRPYPYGMHAYARSPTSHLHQHAYGAPPVQPWFHSRMYPPQRLMQPPLLHPENQWICDYCNVAAFATYEEACSHEQMCKLQCGLRRDGRQGVERNAIMPYAPVGMMQSNSRDEDAMTVDKTSITGDKWHAGSMSLALEESDREWLSELNCFVRNYCVEAFSATAEDVARSSKRGRISLHQVGIRCRFCVHMPNKKCVAAVSFPTSIAGIYESVKRWQRVHLEVCEAVPVEIRAKLEALNNSNVWVPTTRQYWTDSAKALGMVDTNEGIRFGSNPLEGSKIQRIPRAQMGGEQELARRVSIQQQGHMMKPLTAASVPSANTKLTQGHAAAGNPNGDATHIVFPDDMEMIPPYVYFLMRQVEPCRFTEADRFVARSKGPVGYPGFQCRHCNGHAGLGKYFPVSSKSLSTNSTSQNIHAHLLKCRKCPEQIKDQLVQLKIEKGRSPRLEPGWRKVFFDKVWGRLHG